MNAPRQGSFAALLVLSFALHAVLQVQSMDRQLALTRQAQGELLGRQLTFDSGAPLMQRDRVALALLVNRVAQRPDVSLLRIVDDHKQLLATGGSAPTRGGQMFIHPVEMDGRKIGQIELTLSEPSRGEIIRMFWLPLLLSMLIHAALWLGYRALARPFNVIFQLPDSPEARRPAEPAPVSAPEHQSPVVTPEAAQVATEPDLLVQVQFADPKSLLTTLSPGMAKPYYRLNQTLLEQALGQLQTAHPEVQWQILEPFGVQGAQVALRSALQADSVQAAVELASLLHAINEVVYRQHREKKRLALYYRIGIAQALHRRTALHQVRQLMAQVPDQGILLHVDEPLLAELVRQLPLQPLEHPLTAQMREAMQVTGLPELPAQWVARARKRILGLNDETVEE